MPESPSPGACAVNSPTPSERTDQSPPAVSAVTPIDPDHPGGDRDQQASRRSTLVSVWLNVVLSTAQIITGVISHSQGLVADGIHSLSDLFSDFVVLLALRHSRRSADADHPYGHQRYENAASLLLGLILLAVGLGMGWGAVLRLQSPDDIPTVHALALWITVGTLLAKEALFRYMMRVARELRSSMLAANAWHARSDALSSLVVGIGIAGNLLGYPLLDPIAALIVGLMIAWLGLKFGWEAFHDLTDRSADEELIQAIAADILATPGVQGLHDLRTRKSGDMLIVDAHLEVDETLSVREGHDIALLARQRVMDRHPVLTMMTHLDPVAVNRAV